MLGQGKSKSSFMDISLKSMSMSEAFPLIHLYDLLQTEMRQMGYSIILRKFESHFKMFVDRNCKNSTLASHPRTNEARPGLASEIRRDRVQGGMAVDSKNAILDRIFKCPLWNQTVDLHKEIYEMIITHFHCPTLRKRGL